MANPGDVAGTEKIITLSVSNALVRSEIIPSSGCNNLSITWDAILDVAGSLYFHVLVSHDRNAASFYPLTLPSDPVVVGTNKNYKMYTDRYEATPTENRGGFFVPMLFSFYRIQAITDIAADATLILSLRNAIS